VELILRYEDRHKGWLRLYKENSEKRALLLHGYGFKKEEMLFLGINLAEMGYEVFLADLPGHGENPLKLTVKDVEEFLSQDVFETDFEVVLGHSLGARLAMKLSAKKYILLSPPLTPEFEGNRKELITLLRAKRVREEAPYKGLVDVLNWLGDPDFGDKDVVIFYAKNDIKSVQEFVKLAKNEGIFCYSLSDSFHNDVITSSELVECLKKLLRDEV